MNYNQSDIERYLKEEHRLDSKDSAYLAIAYILAVGFLMIVAGMAFKIFGV